MKNGVRLQLLEESAVVCCLGPINTGYNLLQLEYHVQMKQPMKVSSNPPNKRQEKCERRAFDVACVLTCRIRYILTAQVSRK
jgi:hypothetical protein